MKISCLPLIATMVLTGHSFAQGVDEAAKKLVKFPELRRNFNETGSNYIKATIVMQNWLRYSDLNPGSAIDGTPVSNYTDLGIRRLRFSLWGQLTDKIFFYTQFGQNNFNFLSKRYTGAFVHDAVAEYTALPQLNLGMGLTGWGGPLRFASPAVGSIMGLDAPLYQQATNGVTDQFLRKLSVYAKGQIGRLDYRIAMSSPMTATNSALITTTPPAISQTATFSLRPPKWQSQSYLFWQFLDKESNSVAYTTGTYLGTKKVCNLGAGFVHQRDAMWFLNADSDTLSTDMLLFGADFFLDLPVRKNGASVSFYVAYSDYDLGPNYVRNLGVMNVANGTVAGSSFNGAGVAFPMIGSGQTIYAQAGYKFRNNLLPNNGTLMPYASVQSSQMDALADPSVMFEGGVNWYVHGVHNSKFTLGVQSRPVFTADGTGFSSTARKGMLTLQYQISL